LPEWSGGADGIFLMKIFGIAGHSGMGKTTLLERLVPEIASRGLMVSLIKHSHKNIDIDRPGKFHGDHLVCSCLKSRQR